MKKLQPVNLCTLPTPLVEASRLSAKLGGPRILIKRDDLTGLAMGGNKGRCLEFLMAEAKDKDSDTLIAVGPQQSNWLCSVAAAGRKLGMEVILFLLKGSNQFQGNLLLYKVLGAKINFTGTAINNLPMVYEQIEALSTQLRSQGHKPYVLRYGAASPLGMTGYVSLASEMFEQLREKKETAKYLFLASGSGCTQACLILGAKYHKVPMEVVGVMVDPRFTREEQVRIVATEANETAGFLELGFTIKPEDVICTDKYLGSYGPTKKSIEAVRLVAETEGMFLDPIYTGKVMAALVDQIQSGKIKREDAVILYHSGGLPAIFAHNEELVA